MTTRNRGEALAGGMIALVGSALTGYMLSASGQALAQDALGELALFADRPLLISVTRALLVAGVLPYLTVLFGATVAMRSQPQRRMRVGWFIFCLFGGAVLGQSLLSGAWAMETMPEDGLVIGTVMFVLCSLWAGVFSLPRPPRE